MRHSGYNSSDYSLSRRGRLRKLFSGFLALSTAITMLGGTVLTADELSTEYALAGAGSGQDVTIHFGNDIDQDILIHVNPETGSEENAALAGLGSGAIDDTETDAETETGIETETEAETDTSAGVEETALAGLGAETIDDAETEAETEAETTAETEAETEAETAAETETEAVLWGDADGDGTVNIVDVITLNKIIFGKEELESKNLRNIDVNQNNVPDSTDSLTILKVIVGLVKAEELPL